MLQQILAVSLVLALLFAALWLLRRQGIARFSAGTGRLNSGKQRQMQVLERVALDARHALHLVEIGGRLIVVGVSPDGCRRIAGLPAPVEAAAQADLPAGPRRVTALRL
jgi:flagellar protein FliO/FliZ